MTKSTETLIALILTSNKRRALQTGVIDTKISNHSLVYTIMRVTLPRLRSRKIALRSFKNFDHDKFVEDLSAAPFILRTSLMIQMTCCIFLVTLQWHSWWAFATQICIRRWTLCSVFRIRNSLWRRFVKERTGANYDLYKAQRSLCTSLQRKAIKKYFHNKGEGSQNPADFWKMYRPFLHSRNSGQANVILLKEDGNFINDQKFLPSSLRIIL